MDGTTQESRLSKTSISLPRFFRDLTCFSSCWTHHRWKQTKSWRIMSHMCICTTNIRSLTQTDLCSHPMKCDSISLVREASDRTYPNQCLSTWLVHMSECASSRNGTKAERSTSPTRHQERFLVFCVFRKPSPGFDSASKLSPKMSTKHYD